MISFSDASDADPKSQILSMLRVSLTYLGLEKQGLCIDGLHTRMLSGFRSACKILHFRIKLRPRRIWWAYARTARMLMPTSRPNFFKTSRRLRLRFSKTIHKWPLCSKCRISRIMCFLSSGSASLILSKISISFMPALRLGGVRITLQKGREAAYIVSLFLMSLMATTSLEVTSVALTTPENIPLPRLAWTWYLLFSSSPRIIL